MPAHDLRRGALLMVASSLLFAGMGLMVKVASATLPNATVVFFRNAVGLAALLPWLVPLGRRGLATRARESTSSGAWRASGPCTASSTP